MKEISIYGLDTQGSLQAVKINPDGALLSALDVSDITLDADIDSFAGNAIALNSGVASAGTLRVVNVTDIASSVYVTGASSTIMVVGDINSDAADNETPPLKIGGIARTANPTAVAAGDRVSATFDVAGRQVTYPYTVRDLSGTAVATLANNAADNETNLLTGVASQYHDLVYVSASNSSTNAIRIIFRDGTGGADLFDLSIPATSTEELHFQIPWKQASTDMSWKVDFGVNANIADPNDVTNTTVKVMAQYIINA